MARGWESKGVESQMADVESRPKARETRSREELEMLQKREALERSRRRVARELETARSELRRTALRHALKHLDEELNKFPERGSV